MRIALILAMLAASPATACGFDGMFGFSHYSEAAPDAAAAVAMREAAIADARDKFMARHGMVQTADAQTGDSAPAPGNVAMNPNAAGTAPE